MLLTREGNADAHRMLILTSKNSAKLKQYYYFHAEFLEEIRYIENHFLSLVYSGLAQAHPE